ncbi:uncharacterized protein LOC110682775 [Chenopodium quinoa]|uniref:uncharacterized protein LOC110682775 n=1 Tax=Chenopodium quinoa TaxID=63459 RepID=UPI000B771DCD|nr:uncharacterized protein LOC110682775 [Chenopodium quinoa]
MEGNLSLQRQIIQSLSRIEDSLSGLQGELAAMNSRNASNGGGAGGVVASRVGDIEANAVLGAESRLHDLSVLLQIVSAVGQYGSYAVGVYNTMAHMSHMSIVLFLAVALGTIVTFLFLSFVLAAILQYFGMMTIWRR